MELPLTNTSKIPGFDRLYIKARQSMAMLLLPLEYAWDFLIYVTSCRLSPWIRRAEKDSYDLIFFSHTIEKGLSLPNPRPSFGRNNIARVVHLLRVCDHEKTNPAAIQMGLGTLMEYVKFHESLGIRDSFVTELEKECIHLVEKHGRKCIGGTKDISDVHGKIQSKAYCYSSFITSRYSCRSFSKKAVSAEEIEEAVRIAQSAPSQCNRQSSRVYHYSSPEKIKELLMLQGGSRGFADDVPCLLVVTNEVSAWTGRNERNQCYVDGALFAMCLLMALHSKSIGACPLNFAKTNREESRFHKSAKIPGGERIVMLIAVGYQDPTKPKAARSVRAPLERVLKHM